MLFQFFRKQGETAVPRQGRFDYIFFCRIPGNLLKFIYRTYREIMPYVCVPLIVIVLLPSLK